MPTTDERGRRLRLLRIGDELHAQYDDGDPVAVKLLRMRPLSDPDGPVSVVGPKGRELASFASLSELANADRELARDELERRYGMARITRIRRSWFLERRLYWEVDTDRGPRSFTVRSIHEDLWPTPDGGLVIRDAAGSRYALPPAEQLDEESRKKLEAVR